MNSKRALIIDDEPDVASYLGTVLTDHGWSVRTASDGNRGLELAREEAPDLVLLDILMPERGGLSTLAALRKDDRLKEIPVIFVSGVDQHVHSVYSPDEDFKDYLERFRAFHADGFLEKPITPEDLLEVVDGVVHH